MQGATAFATSENFWVEAHMTLRAWSEGLCTCAFLSQPHRPLRAVVNWPPGNYECDRALQAVENQLGIQAQPDLISGGDSASASIWDGKAGT